MSANNVFCSIDHRINSRFCDNCVCVRARACVWVTFFFLLVVVGFCFDSSLYCVRFFSFDFCFRFLLIRLLIILSWAQFFFLRSDEMVLLLLFVKMMMIMLWCHRQLLIRIGCWFFYGRFTIRFSTLSGIIGWPTALCSHWFLS